MKTSVKVFISLFIIVTFIVTIGVGCKTATTTTAAAESTAAAAETTAAAGKEITIGVSIDSLQSQFWVANYDAIKAEAKKLNAVIVEAIADGDTNKQQQQIENFIALKVDAIICIPKDQKAIVAAVKKANEAGIPFITDNRAAAEGGKVAYNVGSDSKAMAMKEAQWLVDKAKKENKKFETLVLVGDLKDINATIRDDGFGEVAKANPDQIEIVGKVPTEWKPEMALSGTINALQSNQNINCIFIPSDSLLPSVISALQQSNKYVKSSDPSHIVIATFDGAKEALDAIKEGYVDIVLVQDAILTGQLCVQAAVKLANGETMEDANFYEQGFEVTQDNFSEKANNAWGYAGK